MGVRGGRRVVRGEVWLLGSSYVAVSCTRGVPPPLGEGCGLLVSSIHLALAVFAFCLKIFLKKKKNC